MAIEIKINPIDFEPSTAIGIDLPMIAGGAAFQLNYTTLDQAVANAKNLLLTNRGERFFNPLLGSDINTMLFENFSDYTSDIVKDMIKVSIKNNEPRVILNNVEVKSAIKNSSTVVKGDQLYDENSIEITLYYYIINNPALITLNLILKRVR